MKRRIFLGAAAGTMAGLAGCFAATEYTITDVTIESGSAPLDLDVAIRDPDAVIEGPARLEFDLTNTGQDTLRIRNTGIWPFGALVLSRSESAGEARSRPSAPLWTDAYAASEHVRVDGRHAFGVDGTQLIRPLDPGATVTQTYEIHGDDLVRAGVYYVYGRFDPPLLEYASGEADAFRSYQPTVAVHIQEKRLLPGS